MPNWFWLLLNVGEITQPEMTHFFLDLITAAVRTDVSESC